MPFIFSYILKFSISLAVMYTFYQLVLRPLTFYQWNRFYLLGYSLLCFVIPFINIAALVQQPGLPAGRIITIIPSLDQYPVMETGVSLHLAGGTAPATPAYSLYYWLAIALTAGTAIMLGRLLMLYASLRRMKRHAVLLSDDAQMQLFETEMAISPFSFGRAVYFNPKRHTEEELEQIIRHEYVHVQQRHTIDLLLGELLCLVNWYNPFAWMIRYSMRQNLEFIADNKVIEYGIDKKEYQYLLLKVVGISHYRIANNFNFSNLKKRIVMMNKMKSARLHLGRFLFVLPLLAVLLLAFRGTYKRPEGSPDAKFLIVAGIVMDINTKQGLGGAVVRDDVSGVSGTTDTRGYYRLSIPMRVPVLSVRLVASREGYEQGQVGETAGPKGPFTGGLIEIMAVKSKTGAALSGAYMMAYSGAFMGAPAVADPSYDDALKVYQAYLVQLNDFVLLNNLWKNNPQVEKFYTSEDKNKQIVFLKDGGIEQYGYPGTPSVADMEKQYGKLPAMFTDKGPHDHSVYDKQWQKISAKLQETFVPSGQGVKKIVFPGDSRVLVQLPNNKVELYDMDNAEERAKFESRFGKLDLPEAPAPNKKVTVAPLTPVPGADPVIMATLEKKPEQTRRGYNLPLADTSVPERLLLGLRQSTPLFVLDGIVQPAGVRTLKTLDPDNIDHINVLKDDAAILVYGEQGRDGVVEITTKTAKNGSAFNLNNPGLPPLYIVDGQEQPDEQALRNLKPGDIERINVWKDAASLVRYGDRAKNGVVEIITKKLQQQKGEETIITADSVVWNNYLLVIKGKITTNGNESIVEGRLSFPEGITAMKTPLIIYNGKEVTKVHAFKVAKSRYRMISLNEDDGMAKYGEKAKYGAVEITSL